MERGEGSALIQSDALINAILGIALIAFFIGNRRALRQLPRVSLLMVAYALAMLAWIAGLVDGVTHVEPVHLFVHAAYAASGLAFASWCWIGLRSGKQPGA